MLTSCSGVAATRKNWASKLEVGGQASSPPHRPRSVPEHKTQYFTLTTLLILSRVKCQTTCQSWQITEDTHNTTRWVFVIVLTFETLPLLQYQHLTDLSRSNRTWHESPLTLMHFRTCICQFFQIAVDMVIS